MARGDARHAAHGLRRRHHHARARAIAHGDQSAAPDEEQRLRNLYAVASMLAARDGAGSAYAFLTEPNDDLGGRSPASLLHDGSKPEAVWFAAAPAF